MRILALLFLFLSLPLWAQQPMTHHDLWHFKRLGPPVLSPDGQWAVLSVTEPSYEKDKQISDLWLVSLDGSVSPRKLTGTSEGEDGVAWSPTGDRLAFSTKRGKDEAPQIYILPISQPGEAQRLTEQATGASRPIWSPDGKSIAFESWIFPGAGSDEQNKEALKAQKERKDNASAYESFPIRHWDKWLDTRQRHLLVQSVDQTSAKNLLADTSLVKGPGYAGRPTLSGQSLQAVWTPDGKELVFVCTTNNHRSVQEPRKFDLYSVSVNGGEPRLLSSDSTSFEEPKFSPDGRFFYALGTNPSSYAYSHSHLLRWPWSGAGDLGTPEWLTRTLDRSVDEFVLLADGRPVFAAMEAGRVRIFEVQGGKVRRLAADSRGVYSGLSSSNRGPARLLANWEDSVTPDEVVLVDLKSGTHRALTSFNRAAASRLDRQPFEEFWFTSSQGREIHSWMALPPNFDESKKYPLILLIHGGPHMSSLDKDHIRWSPHLLAVPGYVVLMVDYSGSVGYGEEFARGVHLDPLKTAGEELLEAADQALERYPFIDSERQAAAGASYGGHLVNWLQATTKDRFRCLVGHAGLVSLEGQWATSDAVYHREVNQGGAPWEGSSVWTEQSPHTYAKNFSTPILLTIGEKDYRVPISETIAAWTYFQRQNVPSRLVVFHDANHWIGSGHDAIRFWDEVHGWLAKYLKDQPREPGEEQVLEVHKTIE